MGALTRKFQDYTFPPQWAARAGRPASANCQRRPPVTIDWMRIPLFHVNAFIEQGFCGNPAAICFLDSWLDEGQLRKVAAENNLPATAFLVPGEGGYELRWFTPRYEVKLCGHATLASAHVLLNLWHPELDSVKFATKFRGALTVGKVGGFLRMDFPSIPTKPCGTMPPGLTEALGLRSQPTEALEGDNAYILVSEGVEAVRNLRPSFGFLERLHPFVAVVTAQGGDVDFVSRYFAPSYGIPEDPVTGSAHCALAPYWSNRLGKSKLHARQISERGGEVWCEVAGDRVLLKGKAVVTMEGFISI